MTAKKPKKQQLKTKFNDKNYYYWNGPTQPIQRQSARTFAKPKGIERETEKSAQSSLGFARNEIEFFRTGNEWLCHTTPPSCVAPTQRS